MFYALLCGTTYCDPLRIKKRTDGVEVGILLIHLSNCNMWCYFEKLTLHLKQSPVSVGILPQGPLCINDVKDLRHGVKTIHIILYTKTCSAIHRKRAILNGELDVVNSRPMDITHINQITISVMSYCSFLMVSLFGAGYVYQSCHGLVIADFMDGYFLWYGNL